MKQSPFYRNDHPDGIDPAISAYLDSAYLARLPYRDRHNPKLLVVFSGGNAVGKTTLSQKIADQLGALALENDAVKRCLLVRTPDIGRDQLSKLTWQYTMGLYARLDTVTPNGLVVRDGVIDWYYDRILPLFERQRYGLFVVAFNLSRQAMIDRVKRRGDTATTNAARLYELIDSHRAHIRQFRSAYTPDITLGDDNLYDHDAVIEALRRRVATLA